MRILFLDKTREGASRTFTYDEIETLRGGECTILHLAEALAVRRHDVVVATLPGLGSSTHGSVVIADPKTALAGEYDVAISNNYAHAFNGVTAATKIIWTHNPGFSWTHVKADYLWKLRHRPHVVHLSKYTCDRSWFLPRAGHTIIHHGLPPALLDARKLRQSSPPPIAIFSSYAGRNLAKVIQAWRDVVHPAAPEARLVVTAEVEQRHLGGVSQDDLACLNIEIVGLLPRSELMNLLRSARVLVAPGHFQETYNLLSVEAAACGVPTVTMGIGALKERVLHDQTGWIAPSIQEMGLAIVRLLTDDALWLRYHQACLSHPDLASWDDRAATWESYMRSLVR
jgi:glycosyltransferase involved in cell wall biosynthesis